MRIAAEQKSLKTCARVTGRESVRDLNQRGNREGLIQNTPVLMERAAPFSHDKRAKCLDTLSVLSFPVPHNWGSKLGWKAPVENGSE